MRLPFGPFFVAFGTFIWTAGGVKAVTAIASVATALGLLTLAPRVEPLVRAAERSEARRVELETAHEELQGRHGRVKSLDAAKIKYTDRGAAADLERIFEPFTQLGDVRHKHVPGVGLGLALVKQVVTALGGSIAVASQLGRGSELTVGLLGEHIRG